MIQPAKQMWPYGGESVRAQLYIDSIGGGSSVRGLVGINHSGIHTVSHSFSWLSKTCLTKITSQEGVTSGNTGDIPAKWEEIQRKVKPIDWRAEHTHNSHSLGSLDVFSVSRGLKESAAGRGIKPQRGGHGRAGIHKTPASHVSGDLLFPTGLSSAALHSQINSKCSRGWAALWA